ncbi:MAG: IS200/IS605 family transposase [bacterium]
MAHTFSRLLYHIIFSTKKREPWLVGDLRPRLFAYMTGIVENHEGRVILINGIKDHLHILCELRAAHSPAEMVLTAKSNSSRWVHETFRRSAFAWQEGYAAFSVCPSQLNKVREYIAKQEQHHKRRTFKEEYIEFLRKHEIEYDERFVFD